MNKEDLKREQINRMKHTSSNLKRYEEMLKKSSKNFFIFEILLILISLIVSVLSESNVLNQYSTFYKIFTFTIPIVLLSVHLYVTKFDNDLKVRVSYMEIDRLFGKINLLDSSSDKFEEKYIEVYNDYIAAIRMCENVPTFINNIRKKSSDSLDNLDNNQKSKIKFCLKDSVFKHLHMYLLIYVVIIVYMIIFKVLY